MKRTAVITGAATGIGRASAIALGKDGFNLVLCYNSSQNLLQGLKNELNEISANHVMVQADLTNGSSAKKIYDCAKSNYGFADTLVNNAGQSLIKLFTDCSDDDIDRILSINLVAGMKLCKTFIPDMVSNKFGRIINISSVWGQAGASCEAVYSASKSAITGFGKALAKELGPSNITVNTVSPGVINTAMNAKLTSSDLKELCNQIPLGRMGEPHEVAAAVRFLVSLESSYISGADISVNGAMI